MNEGQQRILSSLGSARGLLSETLNTNGKDSMKEKERIKGARGERRLVRTSEGVITSRKVLISIHAQDLCCKEGRQQKERDGKKIK